MTTRTDKTSSTPVAHAQQEKGTPFFQKPGSDGFFAKADPSKNDNFFKGVQKKEETQEEIGPGWPFLANYSKKIIYFRLEEGSEAYPLYPNDIFNHPIDGVATEKYCDHVFKISGSEAGAMATVFEGGNVVTNYGIGEWKGPEWLKDIQKPKWKEDKGDHKWDKLFEAAALGCKAYDASKKTPTPDAKSKLQDVKSKTPEVKDKTPEVKSKAPDSKTKIPGVKTTLPGIKQEIG